MRESGGNQVRTMEAEDRLTCGEDRMVERNGRKRK